MQQTTHLQQRILQRVAEEDRGYLTPCWISNRAAQPNGYTKIGINDRTWLTHRAAYFAWRGDVPEGMQLDHLCREKACCNPEHLEVVTPAENNRRCDQALGKGTALTHCHLGHPLSGDNVYYRPDRKKSRCCRACRAAAIQRRTERRRHASIDRLLTELEACGG